MVLGEDWDIYGFKTPSDALIKKKKNPFLISKVKDLTCEKNKISVQTTYFGPSVEVELKANGVSNFRAMDKTRKIDYKNNVSVKKQDDVKKLITLFDTSCPEAEAFYNTVFTTTKNSNDDNIRPDYGEEDETY